MLDMLKTHRRWKSNRSLPYNRKNRGVVIVSKENIEELSLHWSCNENLKLIKKVSVIFHNLKGYDSHLIMNEIGKFNVKVDVIPNRKIDGCFYNK